MTNTILIFDIETATVDSRPNPEKDKLRVFGCYSYLTNKYYQVTSKEQIKKIISKHKYIVGFNHIQYDNQVLYNNGFKDMINKNEYGDCRWKGKIDIDLMDIFKKRAGIMKTKKGMLGDLLMSFSLDYITKTLDLVDEKEGKIKDFDYSILRKETWSQEEAQLIKEYLQRDLEITKKLYDWVEEYFDGFKDFLIDNDVENKSYLTSAISVFTYKAICKELNLKEEYQKDIPSESYGGGYVAYPAGESFEGNIVCYDFNSLYPHIFAQCNLYSPMPGGWSGNGKFKTKGQYSNTEMGTIEKLLMKFYSLRKEYKKNKDPREYGIKIVINTAYGLSGNSSFKHLYNATTASDCTSIARQWTMLARKMFNDAGYNIVYTDTDSIYFDIGQTSMEEVNKVKDKIIKEIKDNVPFPQDTFDLGLDYEITNMWFFKGKNKQTEDEYSDELDFINKPFGLMKKNYIFLTKDNEIVVKNLGVRKKSTSALTRKIFWDYIVPKIKTEKKVRFSKTYYRNLINKLLDEDLKIATVRYTCKNSKEYKNASQLQAQIANKYGAGIHFLIPNNKIGIGKGKKYCTIEEYKDRGMQLNDIDLTNVYRELEYFTTNKQKVNLDKWF